ncbi:hypothetical protein FQA39_LY08690 [Lamprigera yunnana]|nr:hypothetical protein FQA39_LY08690 [Lamprigera yunnana]
MQSKTSSVFPRAYRQATPKEFIVNRKSAQTARKPRWFGRTYTETKVQTDTITSIMPSSCVHVEATLPPCRGFRNLPSFPEFMRREVHPIPNEERQLVESKIDNTVILAPVNQTTSVGWGEYLGLVGPTITVTEMNFRTTTVVDNRIVVTFSVKGCRPSRLPMDLDRCPLSQYSVDEIVPTSTSSAILPTAINAFTLHNIKRSKDVELQPSTQGVADEDVLKPTEDLSDVSLTKRNS